MAQCAHIRRRPGSWLCSVVDPHLSPGSGCPKRWDTPLQSARTWPLVPSAVSADRSRLKPFLDSSLPTWRLGSQHTDPPPPPHSTGKQHFAQHWAQPQSHRHAVCKLPPEGQTIEMVGSTQAFPTSVAIYKLKWHVCWAINLIWNYINKCGIYRWNIPLTSRSEINIISRAQH